MLFGEFENGNCGELFGNRPHLVNGVTGSRRLFFRVAVSNPSLYQYFSVLRYQNGSVEDARFVRCVNIDIDLFLYTLRIRDVRGKDDEEKDQRSFHKVGVTG